MSPGVDCLVLCDVPELTENRNHRSTVTARRRHRRRHLHNSQSCGNFFYAPGIEARCTKGVVGCWGEGSQGRYNTLALAVSKSVLRAGGKEG